MLVCNKLSYLPQRQRLGEGKYTCTEKDGEYLLILHLEEVAYGLILTNYRADPSATINDARATLVNQAFSTVQKHHELQVATTNSTYRL